MSTKILLATLISLLATGNVAYAITFNFTTPPTQCMNATVQWTDGAAPYKLLLVPTGALHPEVRTIADYTIDSGNSFSFPLKFPGKSTFVAVMSDATGFGAGGTTPVITVASASHNTACLQQSQAAPEFFIFTDPSVPQECTPMTISYSTSAHPPVDVLLVIPGGASSRIESGSPSNSSFVWTPALRAGTQLLIVAGDTLGAGKGGSTDILTVAAGNSTACLDVKVANATSTAGQMPSTTHAPSHAMAEPTASLCVILLCSIFSLC
jgi:hypothetical protein